MKNIEITGNLTVKADEDAKGKEFIGAENGGEIPLDPEVPELNTEALVKPDLEESVLFVLLLLN